MVTMMILIDKKIVARTSDSCLQMICDDSIEKTCHLYTCHRMFPAGLTASPCEIESNEFLFTLNHIEKIYHLVAMLRPCVYHRRNNLQAMNLPGLNRMISVSLNQQMIAFPFDSCFLWLSDPRNERQTVNFFTFYWDLRTLLKQDYIRKAPNDFISMFSVTIYESSSHERISYSTNAIWWVKQSTRFNLVAFGDRKQWLCRQPLVA